MGSMRVKEFNYDSFFLSRKEMLDNLENLQRDENSVSTLEKVDIMDTDYLIESLEFFKNQEISLKIKRDWTNIFNDLKANPSIDAFNMMK